jgi:hypothetical protein
MTHLCPGAHLQLRPLGSEEVHPVNHIFFQHFSPKHQASSPTPELSCRTATWKAIQVTMTTMLVPVSLNELFGGTCDVTAQR